MQRWVISLVACAAVFAGCGGTPTGPDRPPTLARTRFLAFGDSLTAGEVTAPAGSGLLLGPATSHRMIVVPTASYPSVLHGQLSSRYTTQSPTIAVVNAGNPGETVLAGALRFTTAFDTSHPEVVILMEGVNGLPVIGPDVSTEAIRGMAQVAKSRGARVFVGSMVPTIAGRLRSQDPVYLVVYNDLLRVMAIQEGLVYVDLYNTLMAEAPAVIGVDGLHPTEAGYRRIAELFFQAIRNDLEVR